MRERRSLLLTAAVGLALLALLLVYMLYGQDKAGVQSSSPDRRWLATAYREGGMRDRDRDVFKVELTSLDHSNTDKWLVWESYHHEPTELRWKGSDSLFVILARTSGKTWESHWVSEIGGSGVGIRTLVDAWPAPVPFEP